jgi:hypothetical protein
VRSDRVIFELRADDPAWAVALPTDLSDRTLNYQLYVARRAGPIEIPATSRTTLTLEMRQFARDFARGFSIGMRGDVADRAASLQAERGRRHLAPNARSSRLGSCTFSPCSPLAARDTPDGDRDEFYRPEHVFGR